MGIEENRAASLDFMEIAINQGRPREAVEKYVGSDFIEHDPNAPSGKEGFIEFIEGFKEQAPQTHVRPVRSASDGDLVFLQGELTGAHLSDADREAGVTSYVIIDIFRFEADKIEEHWTAIQAVPAVVLNDNGAH